MVARGRQGQGGRVVTDVQPVTTLLVGSARAAYVYSRSLPRPAQRTIIVRRLDDFARITGPVRVVWLHDRHQLRNYVEIATRVAALAPISEQYQAGS